MDEELERRDPSGRRSFPTYLIRTAPAKWVEPPGWLDACIKAERDAHDLAYLGRRTRDDIGAEQPHRLAQLVRAARAVEASARALAALTATPKCATCRDTGRVVTPSTAQWPTPQCQACRGTGDVVVEVGNGMALAHCPKCFQTPDTERECPACVPPPNEPAPESVVETETETDDIHEDAEYGEPVGERHQCVS